MVLFYAVFFTAMSTCIHFGVKGHVNLIDGRIIGGELAKPGQFPYMVSLQSMLKEHQCGGSILSARTVITAAHCFNDDPEIHYVAAGSNILDKSDFVYYEVTQQIIHPEYDKTIVSCNLPPDSKGAIKGCFDIAVVHVSSDIKFTELVAPIQLETEEVCGGEDVTICGWGAISISTVDVPSNTLKYINEKTLDQSDCSAKLEGTTLAVGTTDICTLNDEAYRNCFGDSGSPLTKDGKLIGLVSRGNDCKEGYPDIYTRVSVLVDWINSVTI